MLYRKTVIQGWLALSVVFTDFLVCNLVAADETNTTALADKDFVTHTRRQDDRRPDDQYETLLFGRPLTVGGEYEIKPTYRRDLSLGTRDDDRFQIDQSIDGEFLYEWSENVAAFAEIALDFEYDFRLDRNSSDDHLSLERGETWIYWDSLVGGPWALQIGRQNFQDKREWWWDEDLDAIRVFYKQQDFRVEVGLAEDLWRVSNNQDLDPEDQDIFRILGRSRWDWTDKHRLETFLLYQDDHSSRSRLGELVLDGNEDDIDADLTWLGVRSMGRFKIPGTGKVYYWFDYGYVFGRETVTDFEGVSPDQIQAGSINRHSVHGWAVDLGATLRSKLPGQPSFTLGYASGSGDNSPDGGDNGSFRQTGLQDNNHKFRGVNRFRYYGELLQPELSNLRILTVSAGFPLLNNSSVELLFHTYQQEEASDKLRNTSLRTDPDGSSRDIGREIDVVVGLEEWEHLELEFVLGTFRAGDAFGDESGKRASTAIFKINYNF